MSISAPLQLDRTLVVEFEATSYEGPNPDGMKNDIIEIGASLLDLKTGEREDIKPNPFYVRRTTSTVSPFCTGFTGMVQETVNVRV